MRKSSLFSLILACNKTQRLYGYAITHPLRLIMIIIGCGYVGQRVAQKLQQQRKVITGIVRSDTTIAALKKINIDTIQCDLETEALVVNSTLNESIFYFAPPPSQGKEDLGMKTFIDGLATSGLPRRIVYISTTGVYGNCKGEWVDETHPANPQADRAKRRWHAEQLLQKLADETKVEIIILRVAGIYGKNKLPLERIKKAMPMIAEKDAPWTNRIHADDLVRSCIAAMESGINREIYNVCDGSPSNMADYFNQVADKAGLTRPPIIELNEAEEQLSVGMLSYLAESRRLSNKKLINELKVKLLYPNLKAGLAACFEAKI